MRGCRAPGPVGLSRMRNQRHLHVLGDRHRAEGRGDLEGAADAEAPDVARPQPRNALSLKQDFAAVGLALPVDHVEAGRLAGAVRTDHRQEFAGVEIEADVVDGVHPAERLRKIADRQDAHGAVLRAANHLPMAPTMPVGNASTSTRMTAPSSPRQNAVWRMMVSCSTANTDAPTMGPVSVCRPPSSTITMPSIERDTATTSGEIVPLA